MKIPTSLNMAGKTYAIKQVNQIKWEEPCAGLHVGPECKIFIANHHVEDKDIPYNNQRKASIFLHEIIEAINYEAKLNLNETKIEALETHLYQVLHDNGLRF